ncbi:MAG: S-adenosylmethionine decarboxylase [Pirellulales bacterium]
MHAGQEWIVDALGCSPARLADLGVVRAVCEAIVRDLGLQVVGAPHWRRFPAPGGVTGLYLLSESHLACHTFPEHGLATFNLYCCRPRAEWPWEARLAESLGAERVELRCVARGEALATVTAPGQGAPR